MGIAFSESTTEVSGHKPHALKRLSSWVVADYQSNPVRFVAEIFAWLLAMGSALSMALTAPTPPLHLIYPVWIFASAIYAWASWSRRSFGMLVNYLLLIAVDFVGMARSFTTG